MKYKFLTIILILISSALTISFSNFTNPLLILILPGFSFSLALTLPRVWSDFSTNLTKIKIGLLYPLIWIITLGISLAFQIITPFLSDKTPYIIIGLITGLSISLTYNWQFGFNNKTLGIILITFLSISALLLFDFLFSTPQEKEQNIGRQIALWQILVGIVIVTNDKSKKL